MSEQYVIYKIGFGYTGEVFKDKKAADNYCKSLNINESRYVYKIREIEQDNNCSFEDDASVNVKMIKSYINKIKKGYHHVTLSTGEVIGGYSYKDLEKIVKAGKDKFKTFGYWNSDDAYVKISLEEYQNFVNKYNFLTEEIQDFEQDILSIQGKGIDML